MISAKEAEELYLKESQNLMELELRRVESHLKFAMSNGEKSIRFHEGLGSRSVDEIRRLGYSIKLVKQSDRLLSDYYLIGY